MYPVCRAISTFNLTPSNPSIHPKLLSIMGWSSPDSFLTRLFSGDPLIIAIAILITFSLPVCLHLYFYTQANRAKSTPTFLLLGPSGAGKTSFVSLVDICWLLVESVSNSVRYKNSPPIPKMQNPPQLVLHKLRPMSAYFYRELSPSAPIDTVPKTMPL